ncbi:F-box and associated interaction domains-containing protein [Hibiscus syriacus]|uniref:F-box and associated interaction domains-containing protein n=1 Tax=Hibiscus syriacus TaxID=106335 RepID=A0A6A2Z5M1_HIBSY|nr:F-box protein At3g07870-like isoform X1 [Hibiscus syriacus]KAE8686749.1 F-box and associated interaction domains-containing protein [Hibiscus syriacus]
MNGRKRAAIKTSTSIIPVVNQESPILPCRILLLTRRTIYEILARLPIKTIFQCRSVCKRFLCFISDPEFAKLQLLKSQVCILIKTQPLQNASKRLQLAHVESSGSNLQVSKLNLTPKSNLPTIDISHMNACNGLLCLVGSEKDYNFYVCNPILGEFITIQPPYKDRQRGSFWGLGYSTMMDQYKVLQSYHPVVESNNRYVMAEIYTIGTGTWRSIGNAPIDTVAMPFNAFLNDALHWFPCTPNGSEFIHTFDFNSEKFGTLPPPDHFREDDKKFTNYSRIGVLGGCLFMIYFTNSSRFDIWVMKEYGVKETWTKQFVVENLYLKQGSWDFYEPMVVLNNGEILMLYNNDAVVCYNQKRKNLRGTKFFRTRSQFDATAYTPSLVSLDNVAKGEQISRMQSTKDYDRLCTDDFQDCVDCGAQLVNPICSFPPFGVTYGAVNYHNFQADIYGRTSENRCAACTDRRVTPTKSFLSLWNL